LARRTVWLWLPELRRRQDTRTSSWKRPAGYASALDQRRTAALLDLNYYLPCRVQDGTATRTIAVIDWPHHRRRLPLQRRHRVARILASYIGIALQNASSTPPGTKSASSSGSRSSTKTSSSRSTSASWLSIWRSHRELERADGGHVRSQPRRGHWPALAGLPLGSLRRSRAPQRASVHHLYKFRLTTRAGEQRTANIALHRALAGFVSVAASSWLTTSPRGSRWKPNWRRPTSSAPSACWPACP